MQNHFLLSYPSPVGYLLITHNGNELTHIELKGGEAVQTENVPHSLSDQISLQMNEYFSGKRLDFTLPLCVNGSSFQEKVWKRLREIPYGETNTYGDIASVIGGSPRAVGQANKRNPLPIVIPCHRVINKDGSEGGYLGTDEATKKYLLRMEAQVKNASFSV